ncbi:MAG: hypothetical protein KGH81_08300 [Thaumarchaeota archaeon]|nr:hypothetical protein [Nitrososphaerota archaeon]
MSQVNKCSTCNGKGKNTRGQRCLTCNGKGEYPDEDLISDLNALGMEGSNDTEFEIDEGFVDDEAEEP